MAESAESDLEKNWGRLQSEPAHSVSDGTSGLQNTGYGYDVSTGLETCDFQLLGHGRFLLIDSPNHRRKEARDKCTTPVTSGHLNLTLYFCLLPLTLQMESIFICTDLRHDEEIDFFQHLMHNSGEILLQAVDITGIKGDQ